MRLDKFLKVSRIIKRRSVAKEIIDQGRVLLNDKVAKAGTNVNEGDQITIQFGTKTTAVEITTIKESTKKADAEEMFKIVSEVEKQKEDNAPEFY